MSLVFDIAVSGLKAQSRRLEISAANVANVLSLGVHPDPALASPDGFAPQSTVFTAQESGGVTATASPILPAAFLAYQPDNPNADPDGMVPMPNVSLEREVVEQILALRMFQANVKTIQAQDRMLGALLDIVS